MSQIVIKTIGRWPRWWGDLYKIEARVGCSLLFSPQSGKFQVNTAATHAAMAQKLSEGLLGIDWYHYSRQSFRYTDDEFIHIFTKKKDATTSPHHGTEG